MSKVRFCWAPRTSSPSYRSTVSSVGLWTIRSLTLAPPGSSLIATPRPHASANATYSIDGAAAAISGKTAKRPDDIGLGDRDRRGEPLGEGGRGRVGAGHRTPLR